MAKMTLIRNACEHLLAAAATISGTPEALFGLVLGLGLGLGVWHSARARKYGLD